MTALLRQRGVFVTGTDTGVGKTLVSAGLVELAVAAGRRTAVMKPVAAGCEDSGNGLCNDDALTLIARSNVSADYATVNPYALRPPIAPHLAARQAGITIDAETLDTAFAHLCEISDFVVVEGAGGFLVPLADGFDMGDLAARLGLPVLLVVGLRLGCLNHALLSVEAIVRRGLQLAGWVGSSIDPEFACAGENVATLRTLIAAPCLGIVPFLDKPAGMGSAPFMDLQGGPDDESTLID